VGRPRGESRGRNREHARYECTSIVRVAEVGRTHRASCPPGDRKVSWRARMLAGNKLEAPPDAGHEWTDGEPMREQAQTIIKGARIRLVGLGSQVLDTKEDVLGLPPVAPLRVRRSDVLWLVGQSQWHHPRGACHGQRIDRHRGRSGVPAGDKESVRWSTRFGEGSTRSEKDQGEFASSTLKRRRSSGAPRRDRPKLTTANSFVDPPRS